MKWLLSHRMRRIEGFMKRPGETQQAVFKYLLEKGRYTDWGRQYGYAYIKTPEQFREHVPVSAYEDLAPYIERVMRGEQKVLWPAEIRFFSKSSGTTNAKSKFIPMSKESLLDCHFKGGKDMLAIFADRHPETRVFGGKTLAVGGSIQPNDLNPKTYYGDVSAVITKNLPFWAEYLRTPSLETALLGEWETKIDRMAQEALKTNLTAMAGVPTWTLVILQRILEITGKQHIGEVWPNLGMYAHGAVAFGPYRDLFRKLIPIENFRYIEIYNASEGFFGIQDTSENDEMLLMLDYGIYYEFIPMASLYSVNPKAVGIEDVETGTQYAVLISTNGGLWRYLIGDTIKFTSKYPFRFKITGRTKHYINAFGEEVVVENAEQAVTAACKASGATVNNFTAAPVYLEAGKKGGHEWIIEFEKQPADLEMFVSVLDKTLQSINSDYEAKRHKDLALIKPLVNVVPKGTFYQWMRQRGKLGGQHKVPRLSNTREYLDDILEMAGLKVA